MSHDTVAVDSHGKKGDKDKCPISARAPGHKSHELDHQLSLGTTGSNRIKQV